MIVSPFVVFSLPRSRSAWLSTVLCASGRLVGHDIGIESDTSEDFAKELIARGGTCETGAQFAWKEILRLVPNCKFVVVLRDPDEVIQSLESRGISNYSEEIYSRYNQLLDIIDQSEVPVFSCNFEDLQDSNVVASLYKYCTDQEVPRVWLDKLQEMNIQINLEDRFQRLRERASQIVSLKEQISQINIGLTVSVEPWSSRLWSEMKSLAERHFEEVDGGVEPNRKFKLDENIMASMAEVGILAVLIARFNGKLIGYFTWQILPDVESEGLLIANQGAWYVEENQPKAAFKLFDKSVEVLKQRGVKCIFPHHRLQGRGANIGKFFKRRGAKPTQWTYSLWIGD